MLQEFLRRGKKNGQTNLIPISGRVPVLNLEFAHGRSGFQPTWKIFQKAAMEVVDFSVDFLDFLVAKYKRKIHRKIRRKSASRKQKIRRRTTPRNPPARPKNPPQNLPTNPPVKPPSTHAGFFSIEKVCSWRRLQSMDSGTLFGCLLGMVEAPMLKCTCNPSAAAGGMDKVCCAPFQTTLLVKSVRFEKMAPKKSPHDSATYGSPTVCWRLPCILPL